MGYVVPGSPAWGRRCDPEAVQPHQMAVEGLGKYSIVCFFLKAWPVTWEPGPSHGWVPAGESMKQEGSVKGSEVMFDCMRMQNSVVFVA